MLTDTQKAILVADVALDPDLSALPQTYDSAYTITNAYQADSNPAKIVWRTSVTLDEIMQNGFDWTQVDNTTVGKARIWEWMFHNQTNSINPSKLNVRTGIDEVWKGTADMLAVRASIYGHCKRIANRAEALFAVGTGTTESPATMTIEGSLNYSDVFEAMGW